MPLEDPDKIDISLALIGSDSANAVNVLIQQIGELDQRLRDMAGDFPNRAGEAASSRRVADRLRGVVPTGSTSGPSPQIMLPGGTIYNPSGVGNISPVSESNLRARAKNALGTLYRGVPEGESSNQESVQRSKNRFVDAANTMIGSSHPFGSRPTQEYPWQFGGSGGGYGAGRVSGGASLPPGVDPSTLPNWMQAGDYGRANSPVEMPYEGWGALSTQKKTEMAADWAYRVANRRATGEAQARATEAYNPAYNSYYQDNLKANQIQAINDATRRLGGPITGDQAWEAEEQAKILTGQQAVQAAEQAATQAAQQAYIESAANSTRGALSGALNKVAQQIPNVTAIKSTLTQASGSLSSMMGGGDHANVSFIDPALLHPATYLAHPFSSVKILQAMGQQMGYSAGNDDVSRGTLLSFFRNFQNPYKAFHSAAAQAGANEILQAMITSKNYSRVSTQQAGELEAGLGSFGYGGAQSNSILSSAAGVMQNSGLDPSILSQIYGQSLQYGGGSLNQVSNALHDLGVSAKNAHQNLDEYAQGLLAYGTAALQNGATSVSSGMLQGRNITNAFPGINPQDATNLAHNPFIQTMTMMNTGLLPFQQGALPAAAITQSTQQMMGFYMRAAGAFARPSVTHTAFGDITTSAHQAQVQAAAGMAGMSVPEWQALSRNFHRSQLVSGAESVITSYLNPGAGATSHVDPRTLLNQVNQQHLLKGDQFQKLVQTFGVNGARTMMRQLQTDINKNLGGSENQKSQGISDSVTIDLTKEARQLFNLNHKGKKSNSVTVAKRIAAAGGQAVAQSASDSALTSLYEQVAQNNRYR